MQRICVIDGQGDGETLMMDSVDIMEPEGVDSWHLTGIFGDQKSINGRIKALNPKQFSGLKFGVKILSGTDWRSRSMCIMKISCSRFLPMEEKT